MFEVKPKYLPKYLPFAEVLAILEKAKSHSYRDYILLLTLTRTGMRVSDVVKFRKKDIIDGNIIIRQGKGGKDRVIPLEPELGNILGLFMDQMAPSKRVFAITQRQVRNIVYNHAGKEVHPHTLRHSFAVHCLKSGMNLRSLQRMLGHNSITTTQIYLDLTAQDVKEDFKKVNWGKVSER